VRFCFVLLLIVVWGAPAFAQEPPAQTPPPVPTTPLVVTWPRAIFDVRGATSGMPSDAAFYPPLPEDTLVAARGFGFDVGGHVYEGRIGPAHLGYGANVLVVRATQTVTTAVARMVAPQVSFNFGSPRGWSYVSGGVGVASLTGRFQGPAGEIDLENDSGALMAYNFGAGARWFFLSRVAFTFDLRFHRYSAGGEGEARTPAGMVGSASVGVSFR
jgi:hypothetical protein